MQLDGNLCLRQHRLTPTPTASTFELHRPPLQPRQTTSDAFPKPLMARIREVWAPNLEAEMRTIRDLIDSYPYVAMVSHLSWHCFRRFDCMTVYRVSGCRGTTYWQLQELSGLSLPNAAVQCGLVEDHSGRHYPRRRERPGAARVFNMAIQLQIQSCVRDGALCDDICPNVSTTEKTCTPPILWNNSRKRVSTSKSMKNTESCQTSLQSL